MFFEKDFFDRDARLVARDLLGMHLLRVWKDREISGTIVDVEIFFHGDDLDKAVGTRNTLLAPLPVPEEPGCVHVHGMYIPHCMNITTAAGGSVLIREIHPLRGVAEMRQWRGLHCPVNNLANGPGKLCQALAIDPKLNGQAMYGPDAPLRIRQVERITDSAIRSLPRISLAQNKSEPDLRFYIAKPALGIL